MNTRSTSTASATSTSSHTSHPHHKRKHSGAEMALCLGALGVVFGDIGTSPLYAVRECMNQLGDVGVNEAVLGTLSLISWALIFEVCLKYLGFVMKADNQGEGGIFALLALGGSKKEDAGSLRPGLMTMLILFGAALLYGDGVITPAISVLGAAEGLNGVHPWFSTHIVLVSCLILVVLFAVQKKGTHNIGRIFGPVMLLWFATIGGLGLWQIIQVPAVLQALNPIHGIHLLITHPLKASALLGAVVLAITGAEALYADMGHFGRSHIAKAWYAVAFPGLLLNYFGQGARMISHPGDLDQLFFSLAPEGLPRLLLVAISIAAAIIASQALISGTYSLTRQAIQLGYFPRLKIIHTNAHHEGQIYLPLVNSMLAIGAILVVIGFKSSDALASAYGVAVTGTMLITSLAFLNLTRNVWKWPLWKAWPISIAFIVVEAFFLGANLHKLSDGGWLPLLLATGILTVMITWKMGKQCIIQIMANNPTKDLDISHVTGSKSLYRVGGCAVFMVANPQGIPLALMHHLKVNRCLQKTVVLLTIYHEDQPHFDDKERLQLTDLGNGVWRAVARYGYMETPDVSTLCLRLQTAGVPMELVSTSFFFNREMIITGGKMPMWEWQKKLYAFLSRNASPVKDFYKVQPTQIIEIGLPIHL